jgi:hypothetical protein
MPDSTTVRAPTAIQHIYPSRFTYNPFFNRMVFSLNIGYSFRTHYPSFDLALVLGSV